MKVLIISDNVLVLKCVLSICGKFGDYEYAFRYSHTNKSFSNFDSSISISPIDLEEKPRRIAEQYNVIISAHCKQIFPPELFENVRCINIHPGLNPFNRGYYPHVFSIINKMPCGATIHEINERIDAGPIICQKKVEMRESDTSFSLYRRVLKAEMELLASNFRDLIECNYKVENIHNTGNLNTKSDYEELCELDLDDVATLRDHIDLIRALSHGDHKNAFFISKNGEKIFLKLDFIY